MQTFLKSENGIDLYFLTAIYFFSHWLLLLVSGRWWDDWCAYNQPIAILKDWSAQLGRPDIFYMFKFVKAMPESGYRILTFFMFYLCLIFFFKLLKNRLALSSEACFWICALYAVIPANDARIMLVIFPYTLGVFFFMTGLYYFSSILYDGSINYWAKRILTWLLFLISFTLNSNLFFYLIVLLMIYVKEKSIKRVVTKYIDFLLLPIIFYIPKTIFFPPHGMYAGYNSVSPLKLISSLIYIIQADTFLIYQLFLNWLEVGVKWIPILPIIVLLAVLVSKQKNIVSIIKAIFLKEYPPETLSSDNNNENSSACSREHLYIFLTGIIALSIGLYPYIVIRQSYEIHTVNAGGRDSILALFGAAMVVYSLIYFLLKKPLTKYCYIILVICGIVFFNRYYLFYQEDYYRQLGFQYQLSQHQELKDCLNIVYLNSDSVPVNFQSVYVLNANAEIVYGNQKRFIVSGFKNAEDILTNRKFQLDLDRPTYHMADYNWGTTNIDAVVNYVFDCHKKDLIKMRFYELTNNNKFEDYIKKQSAMTVYFLKPQSNSSVAKTN